MTTKQKELFKLQKQRDQARKDQSIERQRRHLETRTPADLEQQFARDLQFARSQQRKQRL